MNLKSLKKKNILVICKDAGGANIIRSFIQKQKLKCKFFLKPPANKVFSNDKIFAINKVNNLLKYDIILFGTSIDKFELKFIKKAKIFNIQTVSFLDHWTDYRKRFLLNDQIILPKIIIPFDNLSYTKAKNDFKNEISSGQLKIKKIITSYYSLKKNFRKKKNKVNSIVLFSSNFFKYKKKFNDFKIIFNFLKKNTIFFKKNKISKFYLQKHPSENFIKFKKLPSIVKSKINLNLVISKLNLDEIITKVDFAAGYDTMALVKASCKNCKTIEIGVKKYKSNIPKKFINFNLKSY
jgi:hypothetical protein